ncbi:MULTISPECIES: HAD family hydrolase [Clostridium]|jgi:soluble P-type ATPase|uniref:HAD family hydrolase n=1 Tax=Clostridium lapidicellarium TaxID=3240931 RepID=A0ABV4E0R4_9CLOT|nr:ATPase P [uncultured Clostridium sp.]NLU08662.1 ATPase P [Clostridiales bacterium]
MLKITIPGQNELSVKNAVFDFNGTLATDGKLKSSVREMLVEIEKFLDIYILSSDTYGSVQNECRNVGAKVQVLKGSGGMKKKEFVRLLGADDTICIGNGKNDIGMFEICALSILVVGEEGCSVKTLLKSDIVVKNSEDALMLLMNPKRITATLRE